MLLFGSDDGVRRLERLRQPCLSAARLLVEPVSSFPAIDAAEHCDTTTRHKTHSTESEVHYRWHPWFGLKVTVNRSHTRQGVACVYATLEYDGRLQVLEMPGWMFDRAICAAMPLADHPLVGIKHLRALRELLTCTAGTSDEDLIETQHLDSSRKGDADEKKEKTSPHATRSVSASSGHADLGTLATQSATESVDPARAIVSRDARRSRLLPRKGGGR
jgi:hypothetical protein